MASVARFGLIFKRIIERLRWHCHGLEIALELPSGVLDRSVWRQRLEDVAGA